MIDPLSLPFPGAEKKVHATGKSFLITVILLPPYSLIIPATFQKKGPLAHQTKKLLRCKKLESLKMTHDASFAN